MPRTAVATVQNLLTYSEDFSNAAWPTTGFTVTANDAANPVDGAVTADRITSVSGANVLVRTFTAPVSKCPITYAIYTKNNDFSGSGWDQGFAIYNNTTGTALVITAGITVGSASQTHGVFAITDAGNGWFKIVMTATSGWVPGNVLRVYFGASGVVSAAKYMWVWGAQLTFANHSGPYVATTGSTVDTGNIRSIAA